MFEKLKQLIELAKILYVRISIMCCFKSNCQIGRDEKGYKIPNTAPPSPSNDDNNNNHTTTSII